MPIRGGGSPGRRSRRAQLSNRLCSSSLARPSETPSPRGPQAAIAGAVAVRVRGPVKAVRREERAMESKSSEGKSMPEEGTIGGKPTPEERVTEGKPTPEGAVMEGKSVAAECKRTGSHEAAGACECGSTKAAPSEATAEAAAKGRPSEAATAEAATAKCGRPKPPRPKPPPPSAGRPKPPPPKPPWKAEALNVEAAVAIAAAASPITCCASRCSLPIRRRTPAVMLQNSAVRTELQVWHSRSGRSEQRLKAERLAQERSVSVC